MSTLDRLRELLRRDFDLSAESLQPDAPLEGLGIDSLRMIEIVFAIEEEFGMAVRAEPAELRTRLKTLADLAAFIDEQVPATSPGA